MKLALSLGNRVTVILFDLGNWSDPFDTEIRNELRDVNFIILSAGKKPLHQWIFLSILEKVYSYLPAHLISLKKISICISKRSYTILRNLKKLPPYFDWVIAHNPGAFYPAFLVSQNSAARLGVDIEDYHPGESKSEKNKKICERLFLGTLGHSAYISYASPLFQKRLNKLLPFSPAKELIILNGFDSAEFLFSPAIVSEKMTLVWFSQNINIDRGLEIFLEAFKGVSDKFELHLIGNPDLQFYTHFIKGVQNVYLHEPMNQLALHNKLNEFDIGLALDIPIDENRNLAITNKIISYAQAGLFILSSHSTAHDYFLKQYDLDALQFDSTVDSIVETLDKLLLKKHEIRTGRARRFDMGLQFDWDKISGSLSETWIQH